MLRDTLFASRSNRHGAHPQRLLLGGTIAGVATLVLQAGQAQALMTPCSFGGNVASAACTAGPYDSDLPSNTQITLLTSSSDGISQGPTTGAGSVDFDWISPGGAADLWEVDVDFDADLIGAANGSFDYIINITEPSKSFARVRLKVDALAGTPSVTKSLYSDDSFTNKILELTNNGFVTLPSGYQTLFVRDTYAVKAGDVLGSFQNV